MNPALLHDYSLASLIHSVPPRRQVIACNSDLPPQLRALLMVQVGFPLALTRTATRKGLTVRTRST